MKKIFLIASIIFLLAGCAFGNTPTSIVESTLGKYQRLDSDINSSIDIVLANQNLSEENQKRYRKLLEKQYQNLSYEIINETIDGDTAIVTTQIEVIDYRNAISDMTFDSTIYTKDSFDEEKLNRLENTDNKVTYTIEFTLNKDDNGSWHLNALTNEQLNKIQGMY